MPVAQLLVSSGRRVSENGEINFSEKGRKPEGNGFPVKQSY
jgi:hypothetical protein